MPPLTEIASLCAARLAHSWRRWAVVALAAVSVVLWSGASEAEVAEPSASEHFQRGVAAMASGRYEAACQSFLNAYSAAPHPTPLYNLAQAYLALARPAAAVETLERYLREAKDTLDPERVRAVEAAIELNRRRIAPVHFDVAPDGAELSIDGRLVGRAPLATPVLLADGTHGVVLTAPDHQAMAFSLVVTAGQQARVERKLVPLTVETAPVSIQCPVPAVSVWVDEQLVGQTPFGGPFAVRTGTRTVRFGREGYAQSSQTVDLVASLGVSVVCDLRPQQPLPKVLAGALEVRSDTPGLLVFVDEQPYYGAALPVGAHRMRFEAWGHAPQQRQVQVRAGQPTPVEVALTALSEHRAALLENRRRSTASQQSAEDADVRDTWRRGLTYGSIGLGAGLAAATAGLLIQAGTEYESWKQAERQLAEASVSERQGLITQSNEHVMAVNRLERLAAGAAVASTLFVLAGAGAWLTLPTSTSADVALSASSQQAVVQLRTQF